MAAFSRSAALGALLLFTGDLCLAQSEALFVIPTEVVAKDAIPDSRSLRIGVYARDLTALAKKLSVTEPDSGADHLEFALSAYPQLRVREEHTWLEATFMIDHDESDILKLSEEFKKRAAGDVTPEQLVQFMARRITPSPMRGWDIASRVARHFEGDCKEYAALLTALGRSVGIPSRVAVGVAIVKEGAKFQAYGHAWSEMRVNQRWIIADSALAGAATRIEYLPFGIVEDEGPGFVTSIMRLTPIWIQRITILGE